MPTMRTLEVLSHFDTARDVLDAFAAVARDDDGRPAVVADLAGERVALGGERADGFGWTVPLPDLDHRRLAGEGVA
jgi:hypothetical protein